MTLSMKATWFGIVAIVLILGGTVTAQPLVTEGLSVYYDFDELMDESIVPDKSGNGLHGVIGDAAAHDALGDGQPDIVLDTMDRARGTGSIWFNTELPLHDDYIAIGGCAPEEICDVPPDLIPRSAITVAAWLNPTPLGEGGAGTGDMSIYQTRSELGSFTHTQLQNDGRFRLHLRGQEQSVNIVGVQHYTDGTTDNPDAAYPRGEWFHWSATYDSGTDMWAMYYNGEEVWGGFTDTFGEQIGDWGQGALLGLVPDINRQLVGKMDEFYLFTRALTAEEIMILANPPAPPEIVGDYNGNGTVEQADLDLVLLNWGDQLADPVDAGWVNDPPEGAIDQAELDKVLLNWGDTALEVGAAGVPEPATSVLVFVLAMAACIVRKGMRRANGG